MLIMQKVTRITEAQITETIRITSTQTNVTPPNEVICDPEAEVDRLGEVEKEIDAIVIPDTEAMIMWIMRLAGVEILVEEMPAITGTVREKDRIAIFVIETYHQDLGIFQDTLQQVLQALADQARQEPIHSPYMVQNLYFGMIKGFQLRNYHQLLQTKID